MRFVCVVAALSLLAGLATAGLAGADDQAKKSESRAEKQAKKKAEMDSAKQDVSFGSQARSYVFQPYTMVNDHRTELKITDVQKVMDGAIDPFIEEYLKQQGAAKAGA